MPQCQFLFSAVFVFQKSCTGNILGIERTKLPVPYNYERKTMQKMTGGGSARWPDLTPARPALGPRPGGVWAHPGSPDSASSPIYSPIRENRRETRNIP